MADIDAFVQAEADALVAELSEWCAIPSISGDPIHERDVRRSAEHLAGLMEAAGLDTEVLAADGGQPAVYGEWLGAGAAAPTITVYGHHDVQPADPREEWTTPPFGPTVRDGCLHARGETGRVARAEDLAGRIAAETHLKPGVGAQQLGKIQPDGVGDVLLDETVPLRAGVGAARIVPLVNENSDCHKNITSPDSLCDAA